MLSSVREPLSMYSGREKPAAYGLLPITKLLPTYLGPCANVNCVYPCGLWSFPLFNVAAKVERSGPTLMYSARENASSAFFAGRHTQELHRRPRARGLYRARVRHRRTSVRGLAGTYTQKKQKTKDNCQKWPQAPETRDHPLESSAT